MRNTTTIGFIGFGEVGQTFARGLLASGDLHVVAYDILVLVISSNSARSPASAITNLKTDFGL